MTEIRIKKQRLRMIGGESRSRHPLSAAGNVPVPPSTARLAGAFPPIGRPRRPLRDQERQHREAEDRGADKSAAPAEMALHRQKRSRGDRRAKNPGEGVEGEDLADARRRAVMREQGNNRPGDRPCCRDRRRAYMATNTANEWTSPATANATAPNATPAISTKRAPMRSTRKPAGVCNTAETTLKAVSASARSV